MRTANQSGNCFSIGIIKNKQYLVHQNDIITTNNIGLRIGRCFYFYVINLKDFTSPTFRRGLDYNAVGMARILKSLAQPKIKVLKFKRRKNYKKSLGHTQKQTEVLILSTNRLS